MNKEQIEKIALNEAQKVAPDGWLCGPDPVLEFTHALLAELAKEQEPVALVGSTYQLLWTGPYSIVEIKRKHGLKVGTLLYTIPLPQPDLVAEIEQLRLENAAMKAEWEKAYEIGMLAKQQLAAAQAREEELLKALEKFLIRRGTDSYSCSVLSKDGLTLLDVHKARKEQA